MAQPNKDVVPNTIVLDGSRLLKAKLLIKLGDAQLKTRLSYLTAQADKWLKQGPWSVTTKAIYPPSGDKHDYASQAPYWWPSGSSIGVPYMQRDGERNPEVDNYTDHAGRRNLFQASLILSLAWYYTEREAYAKHASNIIRTWFLSEETRMRPNLNHAQIIPGVNTGRHIGIIDFAQGYTSVLDAAAILGVGASDWTRSDMEGFHQWNLEFLDWLSNSTFGIIESAAENNHGTFAIMQKAGIALFVGKAEIAKQELLLIQSRIKDDINADGSQPKELVRTRSWHYSVFNLVAYTRAAAMGTKVGIDLWGYKGPEGQSIHAGIDFIVPAATCTSQWKFPEMSFAAYAASDVIHASADAGNPTTEEAVSKLQAPPGTDLWALRPAVEQLDDVSISKVERFNGKVI
ncbi:hypothetical protein V499_03988 [Pseudogymnoascus sp. VKM F-103]|uniref:Alginate lyase domain-containing protein n=1 Tax=Pseudogymnoascus verrucosus TaxID=342668 RepID=A0A2P2SX43_9PEZI|nr:uncharacterized protein VE01_00007 [Pseudogymnoascus verrucosus]KFY76312.1 hypothetical protein V499_03988 [Pseudogymnoascus sp. VKM F-103]OBU01401.2 hypothetical protein VE01_00007 [Pseudogymnoascus verrucosus]